MELVPKQIVSALPTMASNLTFLVLDSVRIPLAKQICTQNNEQWEPLYLGTVWQSQLDSSPICVLIDKNSKAWKLWETDQEWATSGVGFTFPDTVSKESAMISLRKNITVFSEDERLFLIRFYSPSTLAQIARYGERIEIDSLLADALNVQISPLISEAYGIDIVPNEYTSGSNSRCTFSNKLIKELLA
ncbi:DUF4123 domain-containing protein [Vibrio tubiashii]|uniref:DUF4123 domain-containing protein n=1 Tax=Vibrio tubiashii TaxID=29498 RepID=UPI00349EA15F